MKEMFAPNVFENTTVIVTGGGSGLGKSMALRLSELGAHVTIAARHKDRLLATRDEIQAKTGRPVLAIETNVKDYDSCVNMVARTVETFGTVDGLINNAAGNFMAATEDLTPNGFSAIVDIVLKGTFNATLAAGRQMIQQRRGGSMVSILATYVETGCAFVVPSAMAKAGVLAMTRSLAVEWGSAYGIRLNAISPGPFPTEGAWKKLLPTEEREDAQRRRIPLGRFGEHVELANLAAYLLSPFSGYINGDNVIIDGGEWLKGGGEFNDLTDLDRDALKSHFAKMRP